MVPLFLTIYHKNLCLNKNTLIDIQFLILCMWVGQLFIVCWVIFDDTKKYQNCSWNLTKMQSAKFSIATINEEKKKTQASEPEWKLHEAFIRGWLVVYAVIVFVDLFLKKGQRNNKSFHLNRENKSTCTTAIVNQRNERLHIMILQTWCVWGEDQKQSGEPLPPGFKASCDWYGSPNYPKQCFHTENKVSRGLGDISHLLFWFRLNWSVRWSGPNKEGVKAPIEWHTEFWWETVNTISLQENSNVEHKCVLLHWKVNFLVFGALDVPISKLHHACTNSQQWF